MDSNEVKQLVDNPTAIKIGVIGIGNAGSQVAMAAARLRYNTLVMNTSVKDLDDTVLGKEMAAIRIGDGRGSGKGRENAMALLKASGNESIRKIFNDPHFKSVADPADVVFITFSTGGGTGSGIAPYMTSLMRKAYAGKLIIPYGILPKKSESVLAQANTIAAVNETAEQTGPYMLADLEHYASLPLEAAYEEIAKHMVMTMNVIRGDYLHMSTAGMADERDMMTVISQPGYLCINAAQHIKESDLTKHTLQGHLINAIKSSASCRPQHDMRLLYNMLIANVPDSFSDALKAGDYSELNAYIGEPKASFSNYYVDEDAFEGDVFSIMSGMTLPLDRFAEPKAKVVANKERYEQQSKASLASDAQSFGDLGKTGASDIVMSSSKANTADLSFLDD